MSQQPTFASKTWRALKRTASGLGSSRKSGESGPARLPSQRASSEFTSESGAAQNGQNPQAEQQPVGSAADAHPTSREAFLEAYDAATLAGLNRLRESDAACVADVPLQEVAAWNRATGYLVRKNLAEPAQWLSSHNSECNPTVLVLNVGASCPRPAKGTRATEGLLSREQAVAHRS